MPYLHLLEVPGKVFEYLQRRAESHDSTVETEALCILEQSMLSESSARSQAEILAYLRRHSYTPPPKTPDSVELLREDRNR